MHSCWWLYLISRAPVLVAIALVENGLDSMSAVTFIRERRYENDYFIVFFLIAIVHMYIGEEQSIQYSWLIWKITRWRGRKSAQLCRNIAQSWSHVGFHHTIFRLKQPQNQWILRLQPYPHKSNDCESSVKFVGAISERVKHHSYFVLLLKLTNRQVSLILRLTCWDEDVMK